MKATVLYKPIRVVAVLIFFLSFSLYNGSGSTMLAQNIGVGINNTGATPDQSALLDVNISPSGNKGMLIPRLTTIQRNNLATSCACTPAQSLLIFNITDSCFEAYLGTSWHSLWCTSGTCTTPAAPTAGTNTATTIQIVWNWNSVEGATGYQWSTSSTYPGSGVNVVTSPSYTQTGLTTGTPYTLYVWAYNQCGVSVSFVTLTQTTM